MGISRRWMGAQPQKYPHMNLLLSNKKLHHTGCAHSSWTSTINVGVKLTSIYADTQTFASCNCCSDTFISFFNKEGVCL